MKKVAIVLAIMLVGIISQAQESVVKISGLDAAFGMYEVSYERTFNEGINNIKPRVRARKQGKWPNILTKGSMQYSLSFFSSKHDQIFGAGMTAVIDTNSNHDPGNLVSGTQVVADPLEHSVSRLATTTISGFGLGVEYRSYIKTYEQKIGDPPRGWYIAPFVNIQSKSIDFDDNTPIETNQAMNYLMEPINPTYFDAVFGNYSGPWLGTENTDPASPDFGSPNTNGANAIDPNGSNATVSNNDLSWHDVSYKHNEFGLMAGIAIGRQWLFYDKISLDVQIGPQYSIVNRSERVFNGNDSWNLNQTADNVNTVASAAGNTADFYLQTKYGDVYAFDGNAPDSDIANGYYGVVDESGTNVVIKAKGNESLKFSSGFYRDLPGLTDFAKIETYRIKIRLGYAF
tara:strand:+ start:10000 stop:11202 length:1203 start_codon:yes stop_codon:yes gene_type:complete